MSKNFENISDFAKNVIAIKHASHSRSLSALSTSVQKSSIKMKVSSHVLLKQVFFFLPNMVAPKSFSRQTSYILKKKRQENPNKKNRKISLSFFFFHYSEVQQKL